MAKLGCICGAQLKLDSLEYEYSLIPDRAVEEAAEYAETGGSTAEGVYGILDGGLRQAVECPSCGRLWIEPAAGAGYFQAYRKDDDNSASVAVEHTTAPDTTRRSHSS